jgi:hypothetical protein
LRKVLKRVKKTSVEQICAWMTNTPLKAPQSAAHKRDKVHNPCAWVQKALENDYKLDKGWRMENHSLDYATGPFADFVIC